MLSLNHALLAAVLSSAALGAGAQTTVTEAPFGNAPDGSPVKSYTLQDASLTIRIITFGAHITSVLAPGRDGKLADVVLGYGAMDASAGSGYLADDKTYMGAVVGRYGNRIGKGAFTLDGKTFQLSKNNNGNTLHGGQIGFDRKNWTARRVRNGVEMTLVSPDGDMGFPGTLTAHIRYTLTADSLHLDFSATTDKPTVVNLTNHSYFNLAGSGDILGHVLQIDADRYTAVDAQLIPTGDLPPVQGTPFDFRQPTAVGARIHQENEQLRLAGGYDHNWVFTNPGPAMHEAAVLTDPASGRTLIVSTTEPGVQFYSGNSLDGTMTGRDGRPYTRNTGLCLETQHFPDSPNRPAFPSTTLRPGKTYTSHTIFRFTVRP